MKRLFKRILYYCPLPAIIVFVFALMGVAVQIASELSPSFADFYNVRIGTYVRLILADITNILPFSLAETLLICIPLLLVILIYGAVRVSCRDNRAMSRYICSLAAAAAFVYSAFSLGFAPAYNGTTIENKLMLDRQKVTSDELKGTAELLVEKINQTARDVRFKYGSFSVMPYSLDEMNKKLNDAYKIASEKYDFISDFRSNIKYVMLSEPMTYTHISGVYTFFTGEANLNINFPDYTLPYTAAHELAHQRGIAREDEANFMAYLVCLESDDPYILYSAYLNMYEYVNSALYGADKDGYYKVLSKLDMQVRYEMIAYSEFYEKYRESVAATVSSAINDTYLKSQGQAEGSKSYGRVVDLAVALYRDEITA